jgi:hypothetical protein
LIPVPLNPHCVKNIFLPSYSAWSKSWWPARKRLVEITKKNFFRTGTFVPVYKLTDRPPSRVETKIFVFIFSRKFR